MWLQIEGTRYTNMATKHIPNIVYSIFITTMQRFLRPVDDTAFHAVTESHSVTDWLRNEDSKI